MIVFNPQIGAYGLKNSHFSLESMFSVDSSDKFPNLLMVISKKVLTEWLMAYLSRDRWDLIQTRKFLNFPTLIIYILHIYIYICLSLSHTHRTNSLRSSEFQMCCLCWFINDTVWWASMNHTRAGTDSCLSLNVLF